MSVTSKQLAIEVLILPVTDIERAKSFYVDSVGFGLDVDWQPRSDFRVLQITPPGSACSIQLVEAEAPVEPRETYLLTEDIVAVSAELGTKGVNVGPPRHKHPRGDWNGNWAEGVDPERDDYASFAEFADPDGHRWVLQERGFSSAES